MIHRRAIAVGILVTACAGALPGTPLKIETAGFQVLPGGCPAAGLAPFIIERVGDALRFRQVGVDVDVSIVWPFGFAARLVDSRALLYASDGMVVGRDGDVIESVGGASGLDGRGFYVCSIGTKLYR
jgi:hypothetical protein